MSQLTEYRADGLTVTLSPLFPLVEAALSGWEEMQTRLLEENVYLAPGFALPAAQHLADPAATLYAMRVTDVAGTLLGMGLFEERHPGARHPFRLLSAWKSPHTFLTGFQLDRDRAGAVVAALRGFFAAHRHRWSGVEFRDLDWNGRFTALMRAEAVVAPYWFEQDRVERACLEYDGGRPLAAGMAHNRKFIKNVQRCQRNLAALGEVGWRVVHGEGITPAVIETFLRLEHAGWKGEAGTSLLAKAGHREFFEAMITALQREQVFFTELTLDGKVIASTCNLSAGRAGFGFKIAWDPEYARFGPGIINEYAFLVDASEFHGRFDHIDSGAAPGSYIDKLWPARKTIVDGVFVFAPLARLHARWISKLRVIKRAMTTSDRRQAS